MQGARNGEDGFLMTLIISGTRAYRLKITKALKKRADTGYIPRINFFLVLKAGSGFSWM
jgi:hypothetical protein